MPCSFAPILRSIDKDDPVGRNVCLRRAADRYRSTIGRGCRCMKAWSEGCSQSQIWLAGLYRKFPSPVRRKEPNSNVLG
jgi:hypothetical protein